MTYFGFGSCLEHVTVADLKIPPPGTITCLSSKSKLLAFLTPDLPTPFALPIYDEQGNTGMLTVTHVLMDLIAAVAPILDNAGERLQCDVQYQLVFLKTVEQFFSQELSAVLRYPLQLAKIHENTPLALIASMFCQGNRRVYVFDQDSQLRSSVSHFDVLRKIREILRSRKQIADVTMAQMGFSERSLVVCHSMTALISAFRLMIAYNQASVPVVNRLGNVVGSLSVSDLELLRWNAFPELLAPVRVFIKQHRPDMKRGARVLAPGSTVLQAVEKLLRHNVHQLWIQNHKGRVCGVVSSNDIFRIAASISGAKTAPSPHN